MTRIGPCTQPPHTLPLFLAFFLSPPRPISSICPSRVGHIAISHTVFHTRCPRLVFHISRQYIPHYIPFRYPSPSFIVFTTKHLLSRLSSFCLSLSLWHTYSLSHRQKVSRYHHALRLSLFPTSTPSHSPSIFCLTLSPPFTHTRALAGRMRLPPVSPKLALVQWGESSK